MVLFRLVLERTPSDDIQHLPARHIQDPHMPLSDQDRRGFRRPQRFHHDAFNSRNDLYGNPGVLVSLHLPLHLQLKKRRRRPRIIIPHRLLPQMFQLLLQNHSRHDEAHALSHFTPMHRPICPTKNRHCVYRHEVHHQGLGSQSQQLQIRYGVWSFCNSHHLGTNFFFP